MLPVSYLNYYRVAIASCGKKLLFEIYTRTVGKTSKKQVNMNCILRVVHGYAQKQSRRVFKIE